MRFSLNQKKPFIILALALFLSWEVFGSSPFNSYVDREIFHIKLGQMGFPSTVSDLEKIREELHNFYPDIIWLSTPLLGNSQDGDMDVHIFRENLQKTIAEKIQQFNTNDRTYDLVNLMEWASCEDLETLKGEHEGQQKEWYVATEHMIFHFLSSVYADTMLSRIDKIEAFLKIGPDLLWTQAILHDKNELLPRIRDLREKARTIEVTKLFNWDLNEFCDIALMFRSCTQMLFALISFGLPLHLCEPLEDAMLRDPALAEYMSKAIEAITPEKESVAPKTVPKKKKKTGQTSAKKQAPRQKLFAAIKCGDIEQIEQLLDAGVDVTTNSEDLNLNILQALMNEITDKALAEALPEARNQLLENFIRGISYFLKKLPSDIKAQLLNCRDVSGAHSLIWTAQIEVLLKESRFSNELFRLFAFHGAELCGKDARNTFLHTMLGWDVSEEFREFVFDWLKKAKSKRADEIVQALNLFDHNHFTPLHYAVMKLDHASIAILIELGASATHHENGYKGAAQIFVEAINQKSIERRQLSPKELKPVKESEIKAIKRSAEKLKVDYKKQGDKIILHTVI